jgi:hypothetical protein
MSQNMLDVPIHVAAPVIAKVLASRAPDTSEYERGRRVRDALQGILEIGKRDTSNPKYDGYYEEAREAIRKFDALAATPTPLKINFVGPFEMAVGLLQYIEHRCECSSCEGTAKQIRGLLARAAAPRQANREGLTYRQAMPVIDEYVQGKFSGTTLIFKLNETLGPAVPSPEDERSASTALTNLSQEDYDNLVRDAMLWRKQQAAAPGGKGPLAEAFKMGEAPNWDGEGALSVSQEVQTNSMFLYSLANALYRVEATIEANPNGTISAEWANARFRGAVEIGKTRISAYGTDGERTAYFDGRFEPSHPLQDKPPAAPASGTEGRGK